MMSQNSNPTVDDKESFVRAVLPRVLIALLSLGLLGYLLSVVISAAPASGRQLTYTVARRLDTPNIATTWIGLIVTFLFLTTLPAWMVVNYRSMRLPALKFRIVLDMGLCGFQTRELGARLNDFEGRNSFWAFFWPTAFALLPLAVFWWFVLAPRGTFGLYDSLFTINTGSELFHEANKIWESWPKELNFHHYIAYITNGENSTPLTWVFLGSYFYLLTLLVSRWMLFDLTPGLLWRLNTRLAVTFIVGLLLNAIIPKLGIDSGVFNPIAFLFGIVPESAFRWLTDGTVYLLRGRRERFVDLSATAQKVFGVSDLYAIKGLGFWQMDRLMDDGVENIQNLATRDISQLLVRTRFDTQRLLDWIDQALLIHYVGERISRFRKASIYTATDFINVLGECVAVPSSQIDGEHTKNGKVNWTRIQEVRDSINKQSDSETNTVDADMLDNLAISLRKGPNYSILSSYWENTSTEDCRRKCITRLIQKVEEEDKSGRLKEALGMMA